MRWYNMAYMSGSDVVLDEKDLGARLQQMRKQAGLTQQQLCQRANLSYSTLAKIERGAIKSPSIFTIASIARAIGIGLDDLLGFAVSSNVQKQTTRSGVKFIYFDVNGCFVRFTQRGLAQLAEQAQVPLDTVESVFWEYDDAVNRGDMTLNELNDKLSSVLGIHADWKDQYLQTVEQVPGTAELAAWATERYRTGLLTNTIQGFIEAMQQQGSLPDLQFDAVVESWEVNALKPEDRIFEAAEAAARVQPYEILLIDDSRANLIAAKKRGWHTIWFDYYRPEESLASIRTALEPAE
jgi:FMN phosphatase YigB (HAD superfamily)/DNA-binding Xre family transcriptional regulator